MSAIGKRAVVIGAGMGGLAAAGALVGHFDDVVVLERDSLPDRPDHRAGAPQGRHVHALLTAGQRALEQLLPGFTDDLQTEAGDRPAYRDDLPAPGSLPGASLLGEVLAILPGEAPPGTGGQVAQQPGAGVGVLKEFHERAGPGVRQELLEFITEPYSSESF